MNCFYFAYCFEITVKKILSSTFKIFKKGLSSVGIKIITRISFWNHFLIC